MSKNKKIDLPLIILLALCVASLVVFGFANFTWAEEPANALIKDTIPRIAVSALLLYIVLTSANKQLLTSSVSAKNLLWCVPCLLVALANFPYTALFVTKTATITYTSELWLFALFCISVAMCEELFFRGILQQFVADKLTNNKYPTFFTVVITSAVFSLWHLVNLASGQSIWATSMQVGYTFLIGAMLSTTVIVTGNLWICVIIHALFDVGGTIVTRLGSGSFQDATFWTLTVVCGILCAVQVTATVISREKHKE